MTEQESRRGKSRRERVEFARSRDILDVANELQMELVRSGRDYRWKEHDSLVISPDKNLWKWFSRNTGGDAISLVETIKEVDFNQSVDFLNDGNFKEFQMVERPQEDFKYYLEKYEQPLSAGRDYLRNQRGLSDETIDYFLEQGVLAQANAKLDYFAEGNSGNSTNAIEPVIVFKSLSSSGEVVGASLQGIQENWEKWPKHGYAKVIMKNSDPMTGIHVDIGSPKRLIFTESPIDLMSYYELHKDSLQDVRLVSMDGLKESTIGRHLSQIQAEISGKPLRWTPEQMADGLQVAIDHHFFEDGKNADLITLALDNDKAGRTFIQELEEKGAVINSDLPELRPGQDKTDWNDVLKNQQEEKSDSRKSEFEEKAEATLSESSPFPDTSHLSPEDATWLKENWNNISFSVQSTRPSETDPTTKEKHIPDNQESIANTEENAGRTMSYEEVKRENEALTKKLNNRIQSGELSIEFAPDFYLYDVFAKLGNSHPTKYLNDKRMEVLSPIHSLLSSIDDRTVDLYKTKGTPEQDSLYQALKPHQRALGVDISTQFIGELAIAAYNTNKQIESLSSDSFGVYFGERTLDNLSQSVERMLEYPLIESGTRDFSYGFVVTPNTLFHYLEEQEGEVVLNRELLDNLMSRLDTQPIKIKEVSEEKEKSLDNNQETNTGGELLNRNSSFLGVETPGTAPQPVEKNSQPDFPANVHLHFTIDEDRMSNKIFKKNMRTLNLYANAMRDSAQWYLKEMSGTSIHYVYKNPEEKQFQILNVKFDKKNWMHLTGVTPVYNEWVEHLSESFVEDVAAGKGHFKDLKFAQGMSDKLKVLNLLPEVIESDSFVFNDLSSVKKFNNLDLSKAIRPEDTDLLLLFKEKEFTHVPASLMRVKGDLSKQLKDIDTGTILGVYRERDGHIEQLSINEEYVKDGGEEMLSVLKNKQYEEILKEEPISDLETPEVNSTSIDYAALTPHELSEVAFQKVREYTETPERLEEYLNFMSKFPELSPRNVALIQEQWPGANAVATYNQWQSMGEVLGITSDQVFETRNTYTNKKTGRTKEVVHNNLSVKTGEKSHITLFRPMMVEMIPVLDENGNQVKNGKGNPKYKRLSEATPEEKALKKEGKLKSRFFQERDSNTGLAKFATYKVFELSQTTLKPEFYPKAMPNRHYDFNMDHVRTKEVLEGLSDYAKNIGVTIYQDDAKELRSAKGAFYPDEQKILLNPDNTPGEVVATTIHELAHASLHNPKLANSYKEDISKDRRELEAEMTSYLVSKHFGLDTSEKAIRYMAIWTDNLTSLDDQQLAQSMKRIHGTVSKIVKSVEQHTKPYQLNRQVVQNQNFIQSPKKGLKV